MTVDKVEKARPSIGDMILVLTRIPNIERGSSQGTEDQGNVESY